MKISFEVWPNMPWGRLEAAGPAWNSWGDLPSAETATKVGEYGYDAVDFMLGHLMNGPKAEYEQRLIDTKAAADAAAPQSGWEITRYILTSPAILFLFLYYCMNTLAGGGLRNFAVAGLVETHDASTAVANAAFFAGDVARDLDELRDRAGPPDVVVVDPPRAGLAGKAVRRVGELQAPRLVYVSCNPTTLASDLAVLRDDFGYRLERCTPVDMFPHTPHIESVSSLVLPSGRTEAQNADAARQ